MKIFKREVKYFTDDRNCDTCKFNIKENKLHGKCKKCNAYHNHYKRRMGKELIYCCKENRDTWAEISTDGKGKWYLHRDNRMRGTIDPSFEIFFCPFCGKKLKKFKYYTIKKKRRKK